MDKKTFKGTALELLAEVSKEEKWHEKLQIPAQTASHYKRGKLIRESKARELLEDLGWRVTKPAPPPPPPTWSLIAKPRPRGRKR